MRPGTPDLRHGQMLDFRESRDVYDRLCRSRPTGPDLSHVLPAGRSSKRRKSVTGRGTAGDRPSLHLIAGTASAGRVPVVPDPRSLLCIQPSAARRIMNGYTYQATIDAALDRVSAMLKDREAIAAALDSLTQTHPDLLDDPDLQQAREIFR